MARAVVQLQCATGAGPALASCEGGFGYSREDSISGTTSVPVPSSPGTNYSWLKTLALVVTTVGTTVMSNRRLQLNVTEPVGLGIFFKGAAYAQAAAGNMPAAAGANGPAVPTGFARASVVPGVYDASSIATSALGRNGTYCVTCMGVDATYLGSRGTNAALPDVRLTWDES